MTTETTTQAAPPATPPEDAAIAGLKAKNAELLTELKSLKDWRKQQEDAAAALAAEKEQRRLDTLAKDGKVEELLKAQETVLQRERDRYDALAQKLVQREIDAQLATAISAEGGNPTLLSALLRAQVSGKLTEDGSVVIEVKGLDGAQVDANAQPLTVKTLVQTLKADEAYGGAFAATMTGGAGVKTGASKAGANPFATNTADVMAQMKLIETNPQHAAALMKEAGMSDLAIRQLHL